MKERREKVPFSLPSSRIREWRSAYYPTVGGHDTWATTPCHQAWGLGEMCDMDGLGEGRTDLSLEENFRGLVVKQSKGANEEEERNGYEEGS